MGAVPNGFDADVVDVSVRAELRAMPRWLAQGRAVVGDVRAGLTETIRIHRATNVLDPIRVATQRELCQEV